MSWVHHADFNLETLSNPVREVMNLTALKDSLSVKDVGDLYQRFNAMGLHYGTAFQSIKEAFVQPGTALVRIKNELINPKGYYFHPSLLDGVFQAVALAVKSNTMQPISLHPLPASTGMTKPRP